MVKVEVLSSGAGCSGCVKAEKMLDEMKVEYTLIDITKNLKILEKYPIMSAPGIVIDGVLEFQGVPSEKTLKAKLGINL